MRPSTELFELIKALTKSEKRFFKLSSSLQSGDKNYLKIFDVIDKQAVYDEEAIKKKFINTTFIRHLPSEKNHLYKLILKSLRAYYSDNSVNSILKQEIKNIEILYKKALYKECNKLLKRSKRMAITNEKFYYLLELINWEKLLLEEAFEAGKFDNNLNDLILEEQEVIGKLRVLISYQILYSRINFIFRSGRYARNEEHKQELEDIFNNPLVLDRDMGLSVRASTICNYIQGIYYSTQRDYQRAHKFFTNVQVLLDKNPAIRRDLQKRYVRVLHHLVYTCMENSDYENAFKIVKSMRDLVNEKGFRSLAIKVKIFSSSYRSESWLYCKLGEFDKGLKIVKDIEKGLDEFDGKISKEYQLFLYYNMAYLHFGAGHYNKALYWINKVMNDNEQNLRQDVYTFARLFNLLIHYELGNNDLLEYIIKSTTRYLTKKTKSYLVEGVLLKYIKKLIRLVDQESVQETFVEMKAELDKIFQRYSEQTILEYFDLLAWVESKVDKLSYEEAVKRNVDNNHGTYIPVF